MRHAENFSLHSATYLLISTLANKLTVCSFVQVAHVRFLRSALTAAGATPVNCPKLSLSPATFTAAATGKHNSADIVAIITNDCKWSAAAAVKAFGAMINPSSTFDPYSSDAAFYLAAYIFEDVGVTAYKGAVQVLQVWLPCDAATLTH